MLEDYFPIIMQTLVATGFAVSSLILSVVLGKKGSNRGDKDTVYECGMIAEGDGSARFSVKFYLVAMLFVLFDIEVVFMYPWAVQIKELLAGGNLMALWAIFGFLGILTVAYVYALRKGALTWGNTSHIAEAN